MTVASLSRVKLLFYNNDWIYSFKIFYLHNKIDKNATGSRIVAKNGLKTTHLRFVG